MVCCVGMGQYGMSPGMHLEAQPLSATAGGWNWWLVDDLASSRVASPEPDPRWCLVSARSEWLSEPSGTALLETRGQNDNLVHHVVD